MRRFLHRKSQQSKPGIPTANGGLSPNRNATSIQQPGHGPSPITGRIRAPNLRSRSMSVLYGPETDGARPKRFTRSFSFCDDHCPPVNPNSNRKPLTQSEEDEVFRLYTRKLYVMFGALCAVVTGFVVYAYLYNTASKGT